MIDFSNAYKRNDLLQAAFLLHQATERLFMTVLLVFTDYKPKLHDLRRLNKQVVGQDNSFQKVFPNTTKEERRYFELLRSAYIDSRYNMDWKITKEELTWLKARVFHLQTLTEQVCKQKIHSFAQ
ncbi:MAG: HEPN domain-containing protein, partial [Proteobacteria bacterium]|nr:HEPN domain-containing protein [Pseudomonadota bacterium]